MELFGGEAPEEGGTTVQEEAPLLMPGDPGGPLRGCYDWSRTKWSVTVRPLEPEP